MAFKIDTMRIFRAMQAAGLDPQNPEHADRFFQLMQEELEKLPARVLNRFTEADVHKATDKAGDRVAAESGMEELRERGRPNDTNALFEMSDIGRGGDRRRAAARGERKDSGVRPGPDETSLGPAWQYAGHTNDPKEAGFPQQTPDAKATASRLSKAKRVDTSELWKEARRQGKV